MKALVALALALLAAAPAIGVAPGAFAGVGPSLAVDSAGRCVWDADAALVVQPSLSAPGRWSVTLESVSGRNRCSTSGLAAAGEPSFVLDGLAGSPADGLSGAGDGHPYLSSTARWSLTTGPLGGPTPWTLDLLAEDGALLFRWSGTATLAGAAL